MKFERSEKFEQAGKLERRGDFERSAEQCAVSIQAIKSWIGSRTTVEVLVAPQVAANQNR